jgi:hypothetical protein
MLLCVVLVAGAGTHSLQKLLMVVRPQTKVSLTFLNPFSLASNLLCCNPETVVARFQVSSEV